VARDGDASAASINRVDVVGVLRARHAIVPGEIQPAESGPRLTVPAMAPVGEARRVGICGVVGDQRGAVLRRTRNAATEIQKTDLRLNSKRQEKMPARNSKNRLSEQKSCYIMT
jgi:hypothetical protein